MISNRKIEEEIKTLESEIQKLENKIKTIENQGVLQRNKIVAEEEFKDFWDKIKRLSDLVKNENKEIKKYNLKKLELIEKLHTNHKKIKYNPLENCSNKSASQIYTELEKSYYLLTREELGNG